MKAREINLELLIGKKVLDSEGKPLGRIEEIHLKAEGKDLVIDEYVVGSQGLLEGLAAVPFRFRLFPFARHKRFGPVHAIPWDKMDLHKPEKPRATCTKAELLKR
jgi:sporulation protein YlmC with PRC-barrel domain